MLLSETLRKDGQDGQAAESRLALWLCLAGEVGSALEQESTIAFAVQSELSPSLSGPALWPWAALPWDHLPTNPE